MYRVRMGFKGPYKRRQLRYDGRRLAMLENHMQTAAEIAQERASNLKRRIADLGLEKNVADLSIDGYTVIENPASAEFFDRLRIEICRVTDRSKDIRRFPTNLLAEHRVFEEAVLIPKLNALYEHLLGEQFIISQVSASVKKTTPKTFRIHADMVGYDAPYAGYCVIATSIFCCDEFSAAAGATRFVAGSHQLRRPPVGDEGEAEARAVEAPKGSIVLWDGAMWHGNCSRELPGERVVLHLTCNRKNIRPIESYDDLNDEIINRNPPEFAAMLRRADRFERRAMVPDR